LHCVCGFTGVAYDMQILDLPSRIPRVPRGDDLRLAASAAVVPGDAAGAERAGLARGGWSSNTASRIG
jgi:hypothetical protein